MYEELLEGAYDLHVHTGPDVSQRKLDDFDYAERLQKRGMKGFGIKSHYFCSAERARLVHKVYPDMNALGAITLNNSVGGLNAYAVEMAARDGAKIVWMPTFDAKNEIDYMVNQNGYSAPPPWAQVQLERKAEGRGQSGLTVLEDGAISAKTHDVLDLIAENNLILATGHLGKDEIFAVVQAAKDHHIQKVLVTHPTWPSITLSKEEQSELVTLGAIMDECFGVIKPEYGMSWETLYEQMMFVGPKNCILSSDCGQTDNPFPDDALVTFVTNLRENGFPADDIRAMMENTVKLAEN